MQLLNSPSDSLTEEIKGYGAFSDKIMLSHRLFFVRQRTVDKALQ